MRLRGFHRYIGVATNNEAEYRALIDGLNAISEWHPDRLEVNVDSQLVVEQVNGRYKVKKPELQPLHQKVAELLGAFPEVVVRHIEREKNKGADALVNMALDEQRARSKG